MHLKRCVLFFLYKIKHSSLCIQFSFHTFSLRCKVGIRKKTSASHINKHRFFINGICPSQCKPHGRKKTNASILLRTFRWLTGRKRNAHISLFYPYCKISSTMRIGCTINAYLCITSLTLKHNCYGYRRLLFLEKLP